MAEKRAWVLLFTVNTQSWEHGARPTRNLRHPAVSSAQDRVFGLGAALAAARGYAIPDDSEGEDERAARGPGPEPPILSGRAALTHWMAEIHCYTFWKWSSRRAYCG